MATVENPVYRLITGDVVEELSQLSDSSCRCCVTSPPYWGLRDCGIRGQIGLEKTPEEYVGNLVEVFRGVQRVLTDDGTLWLNLGDSYTSGGRKGHGKRIGLKQQTNRGMTLETEPIRTPQPLGMKPKDLVGIPWMVAFALRAAGWYLRSDIIWHKPNPMPESVKDRPTKAHEYLFLLSKSERYYFDQAAVLEPFQSNPKENYPARVKRRMGRGGQKSYQSSVGRQQDKSGGYPPTNTNGRNLRSVWKIPTAPYNGAHFATYPPALVEICVRAGSAVGDTVLDPFSGAATTGLVCARLGRMYTGIDLNPEYNDLAQKRIEQEFPPARRGVKHGGS